MVQQKSEFPGEGKKQLDVIVDDDHCNQDIDFCHPNEHSQNDKSPRIEGLGKFFFQSNQKGVDFMCTSDDESSNEDDRLHRRNSHEREKSNLVSAHSRGLLSKLKTKMIQQTEKKATLRDITTVNKKGGQDKMIVTPNILYTKNASNGQSLQDIVRGVPTLLDLRTTLLKHGL